MIDVAIVSTAQRQEAALPDVTEPELMVEVVNGARDGAGIGQDDIGFTCSGSSDFLAGQAFSFVMTLDAVGAVPPISESHVEMDGAWALYEAWVKLQMGEVDTALVYSYGKASPGSLRDVLTTQLDPYYLGPLWPDAFALGALQARSMLEADLVSAVQRGDIAGAGLDVLEREPPEAGDAVTDLDNVVLTPHSAWLSEEARADMRRRAVGQVVSVLKGELPYSLINREVVQSNRP